MPISKKAWGKFIKKFHLLFLDILFPIKCVGCQKEGSWFCEKCFLNLKLKIEQVCPFCEKVITPNGKTCFNCKQKTDLDGLLVCVSYQEKIISRTIHLFKYRFVKELSIFLGKIMTTKILSANLPLPNFIIPIPLHPRRLRWRGFNQSFLLAQEISKNLTPGIEIPISKNNLIRCKNTSAQMKLKNYIQRQKNIQNAFSLKDPEFFFDKKILLVDDVATTGATLFECARVLRQNGAREVFAVVLARQELKK